MRARKQALEEGRTEGRAEGQHSKTLEIAWALLDVLDDATISRKTGLALAAVAQLRAETTP